MTFNQWMKKVDFHLANACGLDHMDLADNCYADMYEDGFTPEEAAGDTLDNEGFTAYMER